MYVLVSTPAGYALFEARDKKLQSVHDVQRAFESDSSTQKAIKLVDFHKFSNMAAALAASTAAADGALDTELESFLTNSAFAKEIQSALAISDAKLGSALKTKLDIQCINNQLTSELVRGIYQQLPALLPEVSSDDLKAMTLGLAHNIARYKLKFTADKIDAMIVQAVSLLDDLDKELNQQIMRMREWYGWHFPELSKILTDHTHYALIIIQSGMRENTAHTDIESIPLDLLESVRNAARVSMGTEIEESDLISVKHLAQQVVSLTEYRKQLFEYLKNRMHALAPNLTAVVGELVGARLVAHAGSLVALAKAPASTVQIIGAEKALFRALKTKHDTPKYGLIYSASLVGQANAKLKGKISRTLACKASLAVRTDALGDPVNDAVGQQGRAAVENRLSQLEAQATRKSFKQRANVPKLPVQIAQAKAYRTASDFASKRESHNQDLPNKKARADAH